MIIITDHKTRSDFRYNKTAEELLNDVQMMTYAYWVFNYHPHGKNDSSIILRHLNYRTRGKAKVEPVEVKVTREQADSFWNNHTLSLVKQMYAIADSSITSSQDLEPNTESCGLFGGCFYRPLCGFDTPFANLNRGANMGKSKMLEKLEAITDSTQAAGPSEGAAGIVPPDAPSPVTTAEEAAVINPPKKARSKKALPSGENNTAVTTVTTGEVLTLVTAVPKPHIYVDSYPIKNPHGEAPVTLEEWLGPIFAAVAEKAGVRDWTLIKYESRGMLADAIRAAFATIPHVVLCSSLSKATEVFLEVAIPYAASVTKALKG